MIQRTASCQCGSLTAICEGDPIRVSACHCLDCQRRSGSAFAVQARFAKDAVTVTGDYKSWQRMADSGHVSEHYFCPECGGEVWYFSRPFRDLMAIPVGLFADTAFPPPAYSVYEDRKHGWVAIEGENIEHHD